MRLAALSYTPTCYDSVPMGKSLIKQALLRVIILSQFTYQIKMQFISNQIQYKFGHVSGGFAVSAIHCHGQLSP